MTKAYFFVFLNAIYPPIRPKIGALDVAMKRIIRPFARVSFLFPVSNLVFMIQLKILRLWLRIADPTSPQPHESLFVHIFFSTVLVSSHPSPYSQMPGFRIY